MVANEDDDKEPDCVIEATKRALLALERLVTDFVDEGFIFQIFSVWFIPLRLGQGSQVRQRTLKFLAPIDVVSVDGLMRIIAPTGADVSAKTPTPHTKFGMV